MRRPLLASRLEQPDPKRGSRLGPLVGIGEHGCGRPKLGDVGRAPLALAQVRLERIPLTPIEGIEGVRGGELVDVFPLDHLVVHDLNRRWGGRAPS